MSTTNGTTTTPPRGPRRRWTEEGKKAILAELKESGKSISQVAKEHNISTSHIAQWRKSLKTQVKTAKGSEPKTTDTSPKTTDANTPIQRELGRLRDEVCLLQRMLGRKTFELELHQDATFLGKLQPLKGGSLGKDHNHRSTQ